MFRYFYDISILIHFQNVTISVYDWVVTFTNGFIFGRKATKDTVMYVITPM